jgi:hypothetical protein
MALKIHQTGTSIVITEEAAQKPKHKPKSGVLTAEQTLIDELVMIDTKLKELEVKPMLDRMEIIKKQLQSIAKDMDPQAEAVLKGSIGETIFSACRQTTSIDDKNALILVLGQKVFNEVASISLTDLKKYLSENEIAPLVVTGFGSRTLKAVKKYD